MNERNRGLLAVFGLLAALLTSAAVAAFYVMSDEKGRRGWGVLDGDGTVTLEELRVGESDSPHGQAFGDFFVGDYPPYPGSEQEGR